MKIFKRKTLKDFWAKNPKAEKSLRSWFKIMKDNSFQNPNEILALFGSADVIGNKIIVFNICGNNFRLVVKYNYEKQLALIRFIGNHKAYDKIDVKLLS